jgi:hypothetical protein
LHDPTVSDIQPNTAPRLHVPDHRSATRALAAALLALASAFPAGAFAPANEFPGPYLPQRFDGQKVVRVQLNTPRDARLLLALSSDPWTCNWSGQVPAEVDFRIPADALPALDEARLRYTITVPDVQAAIDNERARVNHAALIFDPAAAPARGTGFFADYRDWTAINDYADTLVQLRPDLASRQIVGNSIENRPVFALRIAAPNTTEGSRPGIVFFSAQHAREWITPMSAMWVADRLVRSYGTDTRLTRLLDTFDFYVIPVVNPDGYVFSWTTDRLWRTNRRDFGSGIVGVDPNRNWGFQWGGQGASSAPGSPTYRGDTPFSEPETANLRDFLNTRTHIIAGFDVHSFSQLILEPWGFSPSLPPDNPVYDAGSRRMAAEMFAVAQQPYWSGNCFRNIYPVSGGSVDWLAGPRGMLAWSFELRDRGQTGFILPASQIGQATDEAARGFFAAADFIRENPVYLNFNASNAPPTTLPANAITPVSVSVHRSQFRPANTRALSVFTRIGRTGPFSSPAPTNASDGFLALSSFPLPAGPCGSITQFYLVVQLADGSTVRMPPSAPDRPFEAVARDQSTIFTDDFEQARGWSVGPSIATDSATAGRWERGAPTPSSTQQAADRTPDPGAAAYFTGATTLAAVAGGSTNLVSPVFNLSGRTNVEASFWLSFNNSRGPVGTTNDPFIVQASTVNSPTSSQWTTVFQINPTDPAPATTGPWVRYTVRLDNQIPMTSTVRLRFIARDLAPASTVEAGLDDFLLTAVTCTRPACPADFNGDASRSPQDIFDFLAAYFTPSLAADTDNNGALAPSDIFSYLNLYFAGCP